MDIHILMGCSGSGKSRWAATQKLKDPRTTIVSANKFFYGSDGAYVFKQDDLDKAHAQCLTHYLAHLQMRTDEAMIVVDNTNTQLWEMSPYICLARAFSMPLHLHAFISRRPDTCHQENIHGVPLETVTRQYDQTLLMLENSTGLSAETLHRCVGGKAKQKYETFPRRFRPFQLMVEIH